MKPNETKNTQQITHKRISPSSSGVDRTIKRNTRILGVTPKDWNRHVALVYPQNFFMTMDLG